MKKHQMFIFPLLALLLTALLASAQNEPVVAYMTVNTARGPVNGSSTGKETQNQIELVGFSYTLKTTLNIGSQTSGVGAGKASYALQIVKHQDNASQTLMQDMVNGVPLTSVIIETYKISGGQMILTSKIEFDLVGISQITAYAGVGNDKTNTTPDELINMTAAKLVLDNGNNNTTSSQTPEVNMNTLPAKSNLRPVKKIN